jgi:hypothetical protein
VHSVDLLIHLFRRVDEVYCLSHRRVMTRLEDTTAVLFGLANGMSATLYCSLVTADTVQDIRPGSVLTRKFEDRQRKPDDLVAQEGQRPIAVHMLENLGTSDTGITMLRHILREQIKRVEDGIDLMNVMRDARANQKIPTNAWNTILSPAEASTLADSLLEEA